MAGCLIRITEKCNQRCIFCHSDYGKSKEISIDELRNAIKMDTSSVLISGGEPTENKNLIEIIEEIKKNNIKFSIVTNGSNPDVLKKVIGLKPETVFVSFYSLDECTDKAMTQSNFFLNRMKTIDLLERTNSIANILITRINLNSLEDTCNYLKKKGIKIKLSYPMFIGNAENKFNDIYVPYREIKEIISRIKPDYVEDIPPCITSAEQFCLDKLGFTMKNDILGNGNISKTENYNIIPESCKANACTRNCNGILEKNYLILKEKRLFDKHF